MSGILSLPQELLDCIIEEFTQQHPSVDEEAHKTILACTLVNKPFSSSARRFLSLDIAIHDEDYKNDFLRSTIKSSPGICDRLRSLRIYLSSPPPQPKEVEDLLTFLLANPVKLERLAIVLDGENYQVLPFYEKLNEGIRDTIFRVRDSSRIKMLRLRSVDTSTFEIAKFKGLQALILDLCTFDMGPKKHVKAEAFRTLETLQINQCLTSFSENLYLLSTGTGRKNAFCNLKTFRCVINEDDGLTLTRNFLRNFGGGINLESLDLIEKIPDESHWRSHNEARSEVFDLTHEIFLHNHYWRQPDDIDRFHLNYFQNLTRLKIQCTIPKDRKTLRRKISPRILLRPCLTDSTTLKSIHVSFNMPYPMIGSSLELLLFDNHDWRSLDTTLSDPTYYPSLHSFKITLCTRASVDCHHDAVEDVRRLSASPAFRFPRLRSLRSIIPNIEIAVEDVHRLTPISDLVAEMTDELRKMNTIIP
ncbi:hypothetical protein CPB84DRAFT_1776864 [Gymnopilus junonius]|uniref:Uncharacterized protein n=1 Tax=Gymnopilus junonius TaxID=109634 RepID=A0A9P5NRV2_GYMJU|nr:hypothetical protein CPB84DRAFT_1776864 [Gymnopilus junonius]